MVSVLSFILIISLIHCSSNENYNPEFKLEGKWKEIKIDSIFEKDRKEIIFDIHRVGEDYYGQVISLDNALDADGHIRKCFKCNPDTQTRMILGLPFLRNLHRYKNTMEYRGEIYDIQQRKWFDVKIRPLSKDKLNIRVYAGISFFGKNFTWERGEQYYQEFISKLPQKYTQGKKKFYALIPGYIDYIKNQEIVVKCPNYTGFQPNSPFYFYSLNGRKLLEGSVSDFKNGEVHIKITNEQISTDVNSIVPVVFYD